LRGRGVSEPEASLAAEAALAAFKIGFDRWVSSDGGRDLPQVIRDSLDALKAVSAGQA